MAFSGADTPSSVLPNASFLPRVRFVRNPNCRIRTKPPGRICRNASTYVPIGGPFLQAIEVYILGQFAIYSARNMFSFDTRDMERQWAKVEGEILSGERLVRAIEEFNGRPFPSQLSQKLAVAADWFSAAYRGTMGFPGVRWFQRISARGIRRGVQFLNAGHRVPNGTLESNDQ